MNDYLIMNGRDGNSDNVVQLVECDDVNYQDPHTKNTAFNSAVQNHNWKIAEYLLDKGADLNIPNNTNLRIGVTPLMQSVDNFDLEAFNFLLGNGADVNIQVDQGINKGTTALHLAVDNHEQYPHGNIYSDMIRGLLESGANPDLEDIEGNKPIDFAISDETRNILLGIPGPKGIR